MSPAVVVVRIAVNKEGLLGAANVFVVGNSPDGSRFIQDLECSDSRRRTSKHSAVRLGIILAV